MTEKTVGKKLYDVIYAFTLQCGVKGNDDPAGKKAFRQNIETLKTETNLDNLQSLCDDLMDYVSRVAEREKQPPDKIRLLKKDVEDLVYQLIQRERKPYQPFDRGKKQREEIKNKIKQDVRAGSRKLKLKAILEEDESKDKKTVGGHTPRSPGRGQD